MVFQTQGNNLIVGIILEIVRLRQDTRVTFILPHHQTSSTASYVLCNARAPSQRQGMFQVERVRIIIAIVKAF